jgi:hypothetical protein
MEYERVPREIGGHLPIAPVTHIKAHQDRTHSNAKLSKEAKLNIKADELAEEAYSSSTFADQVPLIPGVRAQLSIHGKLIVSKHRVIARDIRRTKAIKLRIQEQIRRWKKWIRTATQWRLDGLSCPSHFL